MGVQRTRAGRARPSGGGLELAIWYLMRVTGVGLFVLDASWIAQVRWSSLFWRAFDWSLLMLVLFHGFMGVRTVVVDYARGGARLLILSALYLLAFVLFVAGTSVVLTLPVVPK
jgi:succinate dehydrogenase hydrophobic anchor subunit